MIVANLATFPPRAQKLEDVVARIAPQVDILNVVFNGYESIPGRYLGIKNINAIIPHQDTRDAGKFYPDVTKAKWVLLIDDDIGYPLDYAEKTIGYMEKVSLDNAIGGYHTSIYRKPAFGWSVSDLRNLSIYWWRWQKVANLREINTLQHHVKHPFEVDQVGTGAAIVPGRLMPSYTFMRDSQKFVDVRLAKWCFDKSISCIALPKEEDWLTTSDDTESIFSTFTSKHHKHVAKEIWSYAFKRDFPKKGAITSTNKMEHSNCYKK